MTLLPNWCLPSQIIGQMIYVLYIILNATLSKHCQYTIVKHTHMAYIFIIFSYQPSFEFLPLLIVK